MMGSITPIEMLRKLGVSLTDQELKSIEAIQVSVYIDSPPTIYFQGDNKLKLRRLIERDGKWVEEQR